MKKSTVAKIISISLHLCSRITRMLRLRRWCNSYIQENRTSKNRKTGKNWLKAQSKSTLKLDKKSCKISSAKSIGLKQWSVQKIFERSTGQTIWLSVDLPLSHIREKQLNSSIRLPSRIVKSLRTGRTKRRQRIFVKVSIVVNKIKLDNHRKKTSL